MLKGLCGGNGGYGHPDLRDQHPAEASHLQRGQEDAHQGVLLGQGQTKIYFKSNGLQT